MPPPVTPLPDQVIVDNVPGQDVEFDLFDKDIDKDDFLGRWVLGGGAVGLWGGRGAVGWPLLSPHQLPPPGARCR